MSPHKSCATARRPLGVSEPQRKALAAATPPRKPRAVSKSPPSLSDEGPSRVHIGERVEVFWPVQAKWCKGVVREVGDGRYKVHYFIDGKEHWHGGNTQVRSAEEEYDDISLLLGTPPGGWSDEN